VPMNYSECNEETCECWRCTDNKKEKYINPDKCCMQPWTEWSSCSATCDEGVKTRERLISGNCNDTVSTVETKPCIIKDCVCPCGKPCYESYVVNMCKQCVCMPDGVDDCEISPNRTRQTCFQNCHCDEMGNEICTDRTDVKNCTQIKESCDLNTHELLKEDEDECACPKCVPKQCHAVVEKTTTLNYTSTDNGLCVSDDLDIKSCKGSCGVSSFTGELTKVVEDNESKPHFSLVTSSDCHCCQGVIEKKEIPFRCEGETAETIEIEYIASCSCSVCQ